MPLYEYACEKCHHEFEVEQRITDAPVRICPACRSRKVKRLISQTSFVLKGSGWYSDLYSSRKADDAKPDKADKAADTKTGGEKAGGEKAGSEKSESPAAGGEKKSDAKKPPRKGAKAVA
jgi:putative FmdB family regulatory protein